MTCISTTHGTFVLAQTAVSSALDVRQLLFTSAALPTDEQIRDLDFVSELLAIVTEVTVVGYARADLANVALAKSDTTNRVSLTADAPVYPNLAAGQTIGGAAHYIQAGTDGTRVVLNVDKFQTDPQAPTPTNGEDVTGPPFEWRFNTA